MEHTDRAGLSSKGGYKIIGCRFRLEIARIRISLFF